MNVIKATLENMPAIMEMANDLIQETPVFRRLTQDTRRQYLTLSAMIESPQACVFLLEDMTGGILGHLEPYLWFREKRAIEDVFYIQPAHRKTYRALLLMDTFEQWASDQGATDVQVGSASGLDCGLTERFYLKLGYTLEARASVYRKEL